jgi:hypothetical protein
MYSTIATVAWPTREFCSARWGGKSAEERPRVRSARDEAEQLPQWPVLSQGGTHRRVEKWGVRRATPVAWGCEWRGGCRERQQQGRPAHAAVQGCRGCACSGAGLACREMMGCWAGAGHTRVPARVACQVARQASGNMLPRVLEMQASWQAGRQAGRGTHQAVSFGASRRRRSRRCGRRRARGRSRRRQGGAPGGAPCTRDGQGGGDGSDCRLGLSRFMRFIRFKSEQSGMHTPRHGGLGCSAAASAQTPARSPGCAAAAAGAAAAAAAAVRAVPLGASWLGASSTAASRASTSAASDSPGAVKCLGLG